ncbi:hypothetical protein [Streptomyces sp. NPDC002845]
MFDYVAISGRVDRRALLSERARVGHSYGKDPMTLRTITALACAALLAATALSA